MQHQSPLPFLLLRLSMDDLLRACCTYSGLLMMSWTAPPTGIQVPQWLRLQAARMAAPNEAVNALVTLDNTEPSSHGPKAKISGELNLRDNAPGSGN